MKREVNKNVKEGERGSLKGGRKMNGRKGWWSGAPDAGRTRPFFDTHRSSIPSELNFQEKKRKLQRVFYFNCSIQYFAEFKCRQIFGRL